MASLFRKPDSQFWWIKFRDPASGEIVRQSTKLRHGINAETRRAREMEAQRTLAETQAPRSKQRDRWHEWVPEYLDVKYATAKATRVRYEAIRQNLEAFFREHGITVPRQLSRDHCFRFLAWRQKPQRGLRKARHNTVLMELKILGLIMREAVRRGFAPVNPCDDMDLHKAPPREKPELSAAQLAMISRAIDADKSAYRLLLRRSFDLARFQGCRLNETWLNPQSDVFEDADADGTLRWKIRFRIKRNRVHTAPLHPDLVPLFQRLRAEGATETYPRVAGFADLSKASRIWSDFFRRTGLRRQIPGLSFHCLRVTLVTQFARAGVPESQAMRFIGHASQTVHRQYQKLKDGDLGACLTVSGRLNQGLADPDREPGAGSEGQSGS
jgi:integrase